MRYIVLSLKFFFPPRFENAWSFALVAGLWINKGSLSLGRYASLCTWSWGMNTW